MFDILGEITTKDQKGVYTLKYKPVRPPKKDLAAATQPISSAATPAQTTAPAAPVPVAITSVIPSLPLPAQDESKSKQAASIAKHATEVPVMVNGNKHKSIIAQPMAAGSPHVPSPVVDQPRTNVPPPVIRTPVAAGAMLANSPTPVPQPPQHIPPPQLPASSPRPPHPPIDLPSLPNRPTPPISAASSPVKPEEHHLPVPAQGVQAHAQPPAIVPPVPAVSEFKFKSVLCIYIYYVLR